MYSFHTIRWHRILKNAGYEILTSGFERPRKKWQDEVLYVKPVIEKRPFRYLFVPEELKKIYKEFKPNIVISHMLASYGNIGAKIHKGKILMVGWGPDVFITPFKSIFHYLFFKNVIKKATKIVVDSNEMKRVLMSFGIEESKIDVFAFGPEKEWYLFPKRTHISTPLRIVSHRKLEEEYDPFTILKALKLLKDRGVNFNFTFASYGSLMEELKDEVKRLKLEDEVKITGYLNKEELIRVLLEGDIYVSASLYDSTSVSLLEAMALGLIPVISDIKDNLEWITPNKNGYIFRRRDYKGLSECILNVLKMKNEKYREMIEYNYEILRKNGRFEDNVIKTVESMR